MTSPRAILIIKLTSIGDVVHTIPASHALARRWPGARLDWLVGSKGAHLVRRVPWVHDVIEYDHRLRGSVRAWLGRTRAVTRTLRGRGYDLAIDFQGLLRSSAWSVLAAPARRLGRGRWPWLDVSVPMYAPRITPHAIENTARPLEALGIDPQAIFEPFLEEGLEPLRASIERAGRETARQLELDGPFWVWLPQSQWLSKSIPLSELRAFPETVTHLVIGDERYRSASMPSTGRWRNISGLPLPETAGLCLLARRVIGADTGPAHMAALLGAPVRGCFGPTRAEASGMRGPAAHNEQGACGGCRRRRCRRAATCVLQAVQHAIDAPGDDHPQMARRA